MFAGANTLDVVLWCGGNAAIDGNRQTHPVCTCFPNEYGLCDLAGNVREWVNDQPRDLRYPGETVTDPVGPDNDSPLSCMRGATG